MKNLQLCFPKANLKIEIINEKLSVWDIVRKKFIVLTPEEWVRQHLVHHLVEKKYPLTYMRVEAGMRVSGNAQRTDVTVYDKKGAVFLLAECKAPQVSIGEDAAVQLSSYQKIHEAKYLLLTNGISVYYFENKNGISQIENLPLWREI
jgi:hypothetical protein